MNKDQIDAWRRVLYRMMGDIAFLLPDETIEKFRDEFQQQVNTLEESLIEKITPCECDPAYYGHTVHIDKTITCNHCHKIRPT